MEMLSSSRLKILFLCLVLLVACSLFVHFYALSRRPTIVYLSSAATIQSDTRTANQTDISEHVRKVSTKRIFASSDIDGVDYRERTYSQFYKATQISAKVDCDGIVNGMNHSITDAKAKSKDLKRNAIDINYYVNISNCETFMSERGYINHPLSPPERDFPLAFGIVAYKDVELAERLLKAIYRPHNYYCFHVDKKSGRKTKSAFEKIASCFDNIFVVKNPVDVRWGNFTILQAELLCMQCLWNKKSWKYYINLTGEEFPLKTNLEIVKILQAMDGANIAQGQQVRTMTKFKHRWQPYGAPPHNITPVIGSVHIAVNRDFVDFSIHDSRALDFQKYLVKTMIPDEFFFSSINHSPQLGIPGTFTGEAEEYPKKPFFLRYKNWDRGVGIYTRKCYGASKRSICILGIGDIYKAVNDIGLFANKFNLVFEPLGLECLEYWLNEKTWDQYLSNATIDVSYYSHLDQVKYQYRPGTEYSLFS